MNAHRLPHLAQRVFNRPVTIHPAKAEVITAALADRFGVAHLLRGPDAMPVALMPMDVPDDQLLDDAASGYQTIAGIGVIPIEGTLVAKLGCLTPWSGMTGYDGVRRSFLAALDDPAVRGIVLDIDSPGGEVSGVFDLVDTIWQARGVKPIWAILTECAYSAAYALASAADRIVVPRTGGTGSIGVVCLHVDWSRALDTAGLTVTLIRSGERKLEVNEYEPLSKAALAALQADVDEIAALFCATVARNRGLDAGAVGDLQGATFLGDAGVAIGLADTCQAPDEGFADLLAQFPA
jgi:signal peptide peptidase SppA